MKKVLVILSLFLGFAFVSCDRWVGDQEIPAYLKINKIELDTASNADPGLLTSDIRSVRVVAFNKKENKNQSIGVFELPCSVPVLLNGDVDIHLYPVIWQDYNKATQTVYPFYKSIQVTATLVPGEETVLDSVLYAKLDETAAKIALFENFEGISLDFITDSANLIRKTDTAKTGNSAGLIDFSKSDTILLFFNEIFYPSSSQLANSGLYLEFDYWTKDFLCIGIDGIDLYNDGYGIVRFQEIQVSPVKDSSTPLERGKWRKAYLALYPTLYKYFNIDKGFRIVLWAEKEKKENPYPGVYIDNLKLVHSK